MSKVQVLPDHVASQIAAGEVVERPASVVKELVENSLDAGATHIEIVCSSDCRDIRVADNGSGMSAEDAVLAFHRHATSKLTSADDLWSLTTMGFRGEALPSIASVAKVVCLTKQENAEVGTKLVAADGKVTAQETGCANGTVIEVVDLFYNVPARLKFLRKGSTEFAHIFDIVQSLAIAFPAVAFDLINDGEIVMKTTGSGKAKQALAESKFFDGNPQLCPVEYTDVRHGITVSGFIARPLHFRGDRKGIISIVNNRPVRCPVTYKALDNAYADLIPRGRYPLAAISINIEPSIVDVNVHPTKKEIKYTQGNDIYLTVQRALKEALLETMAERTQQPTPFVVQENTRSALAVGEPVAKVASVRQLDLPELSYVPPPERVSVATSSRLASPTYTWPSNWRLVGYLHNTYFLLETPEGLEIVEQHIAHERYLYEQLLASDQGHQSEYSQKLLLPLPLSLTGEQSSWLEENVELLGKLGFKFEKDPAGSFSCGEVPLVLASTIRSATIQAIIESLSTPDLSYSEGLDPLVEATKSIACQSAIKNGMPLGHEQIIELLSKWNSTPRNDTCPHGRPVRLQFSKDKLFQMFHPA